MAYNNSRFETASIIVQSYTVNRDADIVVYTPRPKDAVQSWQQRKFRRAALHAHGLTIQEYDRYLLSQTWRDCARRVLEAQRKRSGRNFCQRCHKGRVEKAGIKFHVHHLTYERLYKEKIEDMEILCDECHRKEHGHDEKTRVRHYPPGYGDPT